MSISDFLSSSVSLTSKVTDEALTGYVILGSILVAASAYIFAGIWMVFSLKLRSRLTICQTASVWGAFVFWGIFSSIFLTGILSIFIIQILTAARSRGGSVDGKVDETLEHAGSLTPQYVLSIGISVGVLLNYRNIGRGWI